MAAGSRFRCRRKSNDMLCCHESFLHYVLLDDKLLSSREQRRLRGSHLHSSITLRIEDCNNVYFYSMSLPSAVTRRESERAGPVIDTVLHSLCPVDGSESCGKGSKNVFVC
jgi:hypothetical protein